LNYIFEIYTAGKIKNFSELEYGVLTQCVKVKNAQTANPMTVKNILLKINGKLNGINHTLIRNAM
jgi:hypothetical protein